MLCPSVSGAWFYFISELNLTSFFSSLTVGLYYCFSNLSDARIFIIMYGVTSMYFSAVMVRAVGTSTATECSKQFPLFF